MPDLRASPEEDVKDAKLVANELCIEEGLEVPAIAAKIKQSKAKLDSIFAKHEASEHKRRMPEICKLR